MTDNQFPLLIQLTEDPSPAIYDKIKRRHLTSGSYIKVETADELPKNTSFRIIATNFQGQL